MKSENTEVVTEAATDVEATETKVRRANVSDRDVIMAYQQVALSGDADACLDKAAKVAGMNEKSYQQRVNKIKREIRAKNEAALAKYHEDCEKAKLAGEEMPEKPSTFSLAEMPRKSGGGRKKTADTFLDVLAEVNAELGVEPGDQDVDDDSDES